MHSKVPNSHRSFVVLAAFLKRVSFPVFRCRFTASLSIALVAFLWCDHHRSRGADIWSGGERTLKR